MDKYFTWKFSPIILVIILLVGCSCQSRHKIPVLVVTDFGRDVDDAEALAYLSVQNDIKVAGVVCSGYIPQLRAKSLYIYYNLLSGNVPPIASGSTLPLSKKDTALVSHYLASNSLDSIPYENTLYEYLDSISKGKYRANKFYSVDTMIDSLLKKYPHKLCIVILSPATDVAKYFKNHPESVDLVKKFYVQGQANTKKQKDGSSVFIPNFESYNLSEDTVAANILYKFQDRVPFVIVGKYAGYQFALSGEEFSTFASHYGKAGKYMRKAAEIGIESFARRDFQTFREIYNIPGTVSVDDAVNHLTVVSNPYDLVTVMSIKMLDYFYYDKSGKNILIGNEKGKYYLKNSNDMKNIIIYQ